MGICVVKKDSINRKRWAKVVSKKMKGGGRYRTGTTGVMLYTTSDGDYLSYGIKWKIVSPPKNPNKDYSKGYVWIESIEFKFVKKQLPEKNKEFTTN